MLELMSAKPIAFNPILAEISNSVTAGLFMSQLLYWWEKGQYEGWIYKTIENVREETRLTRSEQDTAIAKWIKLGVLEKRLMQVPARRFFKIHTDRLIALFNSTNLGAENSKQDCEGKQPITESTAENTIQRSRTYSTSVRKNARGVEDTLNSNKDIISKNIRINRLISAIERGDVDITEDELDSIVASKPKKYSLI